MGVKRHGCVFTSTLVTSDVSARTRVQARSFEVVIMATATSWRANIVAIEFVCAREDTD